MRSDSLAFRLVAGAALWSAIALVAGGLILSAIFRNSVERSFDSRLNVLLHSLIATTEVNAEGEIVREGGLSETRFDLAYSGWYWQIWPVAPRPALRCALTVRPVARSLSRREDGAQRHRPQDFRYDRAREPASPRGRAAGNAAGL